MSVHIVLCPGMKLVASVVFHVTEPLFVTILGPAAVSFGSTWQSGPKEIVNPTADKWQFSVQASHVGPIGSEVPVWVASRSKEATVVGVGAPGKPEAFLTYTTAGHDCQAAR